MRRHPYTNKGIVDLILSSRSSLFELLMVAILLAIGVNMITNAIPIIAKLDPFKNLCIGCAFIFAAIIYFAFKLFGKRTFNREYEAVIIYDSKANELVNIPRYEFTEEITHFFKGAFIENSALKIIWQKEPLSSIPEVLWKEENEDAKRPKSMDLIAEAVEYFVLSKLSVHLEDYFSEENFSKVYLKEFQRVDIPEVLLSNRFLELFSRPMQDRSYFIKYVNDEEDDIDGLWNEDGTFYEKLKIVLPKKARIIRLKPHAIQIATSRFNMYVEVGFDGCIFNLPCGFAKRYLRITNLEDEDYFARHFQFQINLAISIEFHFGALLFTAGWEYYRWVDSFIANLRSKLAFENFLSKINWETAHTILMTDPKAKKQAPC